MATIAEITNLIDCGLSATYGTGSLGCKAFFRNVSSAWLTTKGFKFSKTEVLDEDYVQQLQAEGKLIILKGITAFTDNSEEMVTETYDDGTEQLVRKGKYKFLMEFVNGLYFNLALNSLNSQDSYDVSLVDSDNNILGTLAVDGSVKGFSAGMIQAAKATFATGSAGSKQGLNIQLSDPDELDDSFSFISGKSLAPYKPKNADGVNEVVLSYNTAPADGATTLVVKAVLKQGGGAFKGALVANFLYTVGGTTVTPSAIAEVDGVYTLTVTALATNGVLALRLYNSADNRAGIELGNAVYKSNTLAATVV
tara:strand:- start:78 stop:1004 length:927 start_codon:yes stop_codon:yes gene_type:complete